MAKQLRIATALAIAARSKSLDSSLPIRKLLLAIEAVEATLARDEPVVPVAHETLQNALANVGGTGMSGHAARVNALSVTPDSRWLISASADRTVRIWDLTSRDATFRAVTLLGHRVGVELEEVSADGRWLATLSHDGELRLWELRNTSGSPEMVVQVGSQSPYALRISPDSRWLVAFDNQDMRIWNLLSKERAATVRSLKGHHQRLSAMAISSDSRWLYSASRDSTVRAWDLTSETMEKSSFTLQGAEQGVSSLAVTPDGERLLSGGRDGRLRVWDVAGDRPPEQPAFIVPAHDAGIVSMLVSPNGKWLITQGGPGAHIRIWEILQTGHTTPLAELHDYILQGISPDSRWMVTWKNSSIYLWDLTAGNPTDHVVTLHGHDDRIRSVAFSPDGRWLFTGSLDHTIRRWDLTLADPSTSEVVWQGHQDRVECLATSSNAHRLVTGGSDGKLRFWDIASGHP